MTVCRSAPGVLAAVVMTACASTPYGAAGQGLLVDGKLPFGYTETKREDGSYVLRVQHPDPALALQYWQRRAVELCGGEPEAKSIYRADQKPPQSAYDAVQFPTVEGFVTCVRPSPVAAVRP